MIPQVGTFEYAAEFTKGGFSHSDIVLEGTDQRGTNEMRLVGLKPRIRFWNDRLVVIASEKNKSSVRNVSFPIGDAVRQTAQPGDQLYLVRTGCGGIGLSLIREEKLVLATGAIGRVPLGEDIQFVRSDDDNDIFSHNYVKDRPLELRVKGERLILQERDVLEAEGYHIYVERCWKDGMPGTDECVSLCFTDDVAIKRAAMRSAILLANGNLKMVEWTSSESFCSL
jgi:hypothetical protein